MANVYIFLIVNDRSSIVIPEVRHLKARSEREEEVGTLCMPVKIMHDANILFCLMPDNFERGSCRALPLQCHPVVQFYA